MTDSSVIPTLYIRCPALHSRGDLLNGFFYAHREALGLDSAYETPSLSADRGIDKRDEAVEGGAASPRLPADFPVEVVYVRLSRKPYFLVEWRYPTAEEEGKRRHTDNDAAVEDADAGASADASPPKRERLSTEWLLQLTERTRALGDEKSGGSGLVWREQPVVISAALAGMTVAAERTKLELRDAQLKTQRVAEKRARDEAETAKQEGEKKTSLAKTAPAFVPRSVRRR